MNTSTIYLFSREYGDFGKFRFSGSYGIKPYKYAVYYKLTDASVWRRARDYEAGSTYSLKMTDKGTYNIRVKMKDAEGTVSNKDFVVTVE